MRRLVFVILVSSLLVTLAFTQRGNIPAVKASPDVNQGDLILAGNNVTTIEGRFDINGSIIVEENATLILKNAIIDFKQSYSYQHNMSFLNPVDGNPRLLAENTTITSSTWFLIQLFHNSSGTLYETTIDYYLKLTDSSVMSVANSTIGWVVLHDDTSLSFSHSTISDMEVYAHGGSPYVYADNSTIGGFMTSPMRVNCTIANVYPGFFDFWDYHLNASIIAPHGWAPNATIRRSTVNNWAFWFQTSCNATIFDSKLYYLRCYTDSVACLTNVTASQFEHYLGGRAYLSWYLDVHVVDSISQNVPSANVTATYPDSTVAELESTDMNGWTRLTLLEKMMNASGEYPVGNYTVEASYETYSDDTIVNITENQVITLTLADFVIPEFPSFLILPLFMIATLLAVIVYKRKHQTRNRKREV